MRFSIIENFTSRFVDINLDEHKMQNLCKFINYYHRNCQIFSYLFALLLILIVQFHKIVKQKFTLLSTHLLTYSVFCDDILYQHLKR